MVSASNHGAGRFPTHGWITRLFGLIRPNHLSLHACGRWVRKLLIGENEIPTWLLSYCNRVQLNFHAENAHCQPKLFRRKLAEIGSKQFIFQFDGAGGNKHLDAMLEQDSEPVVNAVPLFDISGGAGILPSEWPKPYYMSDDMSHSYHGYAGGLGPENLETQLPKIAKSAGDCRIWIDMETRVRSDGDRQFDLAKVVRCLEIAKPFIDSPRITP